ncbi:MAG: hypothetical protein K5854_08305, partial [Prevotella sp.]|nr:hypothetical protein [Prevotella sp.]MCR4774343.1 hypothetical protein [Prevotella sp.]
IYKIMYNTVDLYMNMLATLPDETKFDIAKKLLNSIKQKAVSFVGKKTEEKDAFAALSNAWDDNDMSAIEVAEDLRAHRVFTRNVEEW